MPRSLLCASLMLTLAACTTYEPLPLPQGFAGLDAAVEERPPRRGWLGVEVEPNESDSLDELEILPGVRIIGVDPASPAASADIRAGDVLLRFDETRVDDPDRLESLLLGLQQEREITIGLQRGSREFEVDLAIPTRSPADKQRTLHHIERVLVRAAFRNTFTNGAYPVVSWLAPDSPLREAGVQVKDKVVAFQGQDPGSAAELVRRIGVELEAGEEASLTVRTGKDRPRELKFEAWDPGRVMTGFQIWPLVIWEEAPQENQEQLMIGDLVLLSLFKKTRLGTEREYSILSLISWKTGDPVLESQLPPTPSVGEE